MPVRAWWIIAFFVLLLHGCAQKPAEPIRILAIPHYPGARILSIDPAAPGSTPGFTYHKTVFETPDSPATVLAWYDKAMLAEGWFVQTKYDNANTSAGYLILAETPGATQVEVGLREGKCRTDR
jgi:hypothetical protein